MSLSKLQNIATINASKELEERVLRLLDKLRTDATVDQRWLALARTNIEQGFMDVERAVNRPERVKLPEDEA
jgi:cytochrome c-type biogenesis protein CcmH/NrfG